VPVQLPQRPPRSQQRPRSRFALSSYLSLGYVSAGARTTGLCRNRGRECDKATRPTRRRAQAIAQQTFSDDLTVGGGEASYTEVM
jgi:hypothetical protein